MSLTENESLWLELKNSKKAFWYHYFSETKFEIAMEDDIGFTESEQSILLCLLNII